MAQSSVAITAGSGTPIDVWVTASNSFNRQGIVVADPSTDAAASAVKNAAPSSSDYGLTVRQVGLPAAAALADATANPTLSEIQTFPMMYNGTTHDRIRGDTTNGLYVQIKSSVAIVANAGTNLNTSLLALESGGNLATLAGAVTSSKVQVNVAQIGGGTIATAATGIQKVGLTDGSGNAITSTTGALDINVKSGGITNSVSDKQGSATAFTITLASLANSTAGVGRQSTLVDNTSNLYIGAKIYLKIKTGTSPTANTLVYVYLIQYDNSAIADDGAGTSDAGLTVVNATLLGTILLSVSTTGTVVYGVFDTRNVADSLGPKWGIAIVNSTGVALNGTEGNHGYNYIGIKRQMN